MVSERTETASVRTFDVLHVDDESSFLDLVSVFFERELEAATVTTATGAEAGLKTLEDGSFDCVVSDYDMPGTNGLEFLEAVRAKHPELPFILYTGKGSEDIASRAINAGVTGYLQKGGPEQHRRLINRVEHAVAEYRAKMESERYSTVLTALGYPIYVVDETGTFEYVNEAFCELTGYDRETIIGGSPDLIKSDDGTERANDALRAIVSSTGPETMQFEVDIQTRDGRTVPCRDHMAALPFEDEFRGSVGILRNVSEQQQTRAELIRQNKRLEEFASVISHDLRTPLGEAKTAATLARETGDEAYFEKLDDTHDRIDRMISELLTLAREGETVAVPDSVSVETILSESWDAVSGNRDTLDVATELIVEAEPDRLRRLFENLLRNAIEHTDGPATVTVGELDDGFYVADDGPGIPPETREDVFEPGYTTADDGTGFGLAIVNRIAEAHCWTVTVTESDAGGARFEITDVDIISRTDAVPNEPI
ncbi:MAG: response regulator [Natronomonas sp.]